MNPISQIKLEREDKRIKLTLPYDPTYIKKIKAIPGYRWHPDKKYWSFPYSEDILIYSDYVTIKKILSLFDGENIQVDTSPRVVHKRSTSQNIPIWEHKRSSSVILSYMPYFRKFILGVMYSRISLERRK